MATTLNFSTTNLGVRKARREGKPFMGVDGEGCGADRHGRQHYKLLRAGPYELYKGRALNTFDCLDFICNLPDTHILVGFAFGYDTTQILRDLDQGRLARIFDDTKEARAGVSRYTYWNGFAIEYLPKNYLRVCRLQRVTVEDVRTGLPKPGYERVSGTTRTIWEVFGFFQCSFLKAIQNFDIGKRYWDEIERNKRKRAKFNRITPSIRRYCELECALLAAMMERFRTVCHAAGIHPNQWAGAGKLAAYLHRTNDSITGNALTIRLQTCPELKTMANDAYYGGRFEITRTGDIGPCFECDINSAYPAAMLSLPCLKHGTWQRVTPLWLRNAPSAALYVARVHFIHPEGTPLCGLPVRHKQGHLYWPNEGEGVYWSPELRSAERLGATLDYKHGWRYVSHCKCQPFAWVSELYAERLRIGKATAGYPIKLGLNSLYGKLAQRIGAPKYGNFIHAGLITAITRAKLNDAIALAPGDIVMLATDAIVSTSQLALPIGPNLGEWEAKRYQSLFVVMPGLYWEGHRAGDKRKTRGTPTSIFARHMHRFEKRWRTWCANKDAALPYRLPDGTQSRGRSRHLPHAGSQGEPLARKWKRDTPAVTINLTLFIGLKLAHARGDMLSAGKWHRTAREFNFEWGRKRSMWPVAWDAPTCMRTYPIKGGPDHISVPHKGNMERIAELDRHRLENEDQPEGVLDQSPP